MRNKSNDNKSEQVSDDQADIGHSSSSAYEVEEQVFVRQQYENTSSFEMDIEKAKAMAATGQQLLEGDHNESPVVVADDNDDETDAIKRSLAELREIEQKVDYDDYDEPGLLQRIKNLFIR